MIPLYDSCDACTIWHLNLLVSVVCPAVQVRMLIEAGADPRKANADGVTVLHRVRASRFQCDSSGCCVVAAVARCLRYIACLFLV